MVYFKFIELKGSWYHALLILSRKDMLFTFSVPFSYSGENFCRKVLKRRYIGKNQAILFVQNFLVEL